MLRWFPSPARLHSRSTSRAVQTVQDRDLQSTSAPLPCRIRRSCNASLRRLPARGDPELRGFRGWVLGGCGHPSGASVRIAPRTWARRLTGRCTGVTSPAGAWNWAWKSPATRQAVAFFRTRVESPLFLAGLLSGREPGGAARPRRAAAGRRQGCRGSWSMGRTARPAPWGCPAETVWLFATKVLPCVGRFGSRGAIEALDRSWHPLGFMSAAPRSGGVAE